VRRVLRPDGTFWLNIGDCYSGSGRGPTGHNGLGDQAARQGFHSPGASPGRRKSLMLIPQRLTLALYEDGWTIRDDIAWVKNNPMPESVDDRCTKAYEHVIMATKTPDYHWNHDAAQEPTTDGKATRNMRNWWLINTRGYDGAHFAVFPESLVERCVRLSTRPGDLVLDPFAGSGTTLAVATRLGRTALGIELNPEYADLAVKRLAA
jgi:site-specific DNA-methyltransferase (cytosine-N4-specific)